MKSLLVCALAIILTACPKTHSGGGYVPSSLSPRYYSPDGWPYYSATGVDASGFPTYGRRSEPRNISCSPTYRGGMDCRMY